MSKAGKRMKDAKNYFVPAEEVSKPAVLLCIMLFAYQANSQCTSGIYIPCDFTNCVINGNIKTCETLFEYVISLPAPGTEFCATFVDSQDNVTAWGTLTLSYLASSSSMVPNFLYNTYGWTGEQQTIHRCDDAGPCSGNCQTLYTTDPTGAGQISDQTTYLNPGLTSCRRGGGGWDNGCTTFGQGCIYSAYGLAYNSTEFQVGQVYDLGQVTNNPVLGYYFNLGPNFTASGVINYNDAIQGALPNFTLSTITGISTDNDAFASNRLVYDLAAQSVFLAPCSDTDAPVAGSIGDIQTASQVISTTTYRGFSDYDPSSIIETDAGTRTLYTFLDSGYQKVYNFPFFPMALDGNLWSADFFVEPICDSCPGSFISGLVLESNLTNPGPLLFGFSTSRNLTMTRLVDLVCPDIEYVNGTGCFSCFQGFSVLIHLKSTCSPGLVTLTTNTTNVTLATTSEVVSTDWQDFIIYGYTGVQYPEICITAYGSSQIFDGICFGLKLIPFNGVENNTFSGGNTYPDFSKGSNWDKFLKFFVAIGVFFRRIFDGVASFWEYIIFSVFVLALLVGFIFLLPALMSFYKDKKDKAKLRALKMKDKLNFLRKNDQNLPLTPQPSASSTTAYGRLSRPFSLT